MNFQTYTAPGAEIVAAPKYSAASTLFAAEGTSFHHCDSCGVVILVGRKLTAELPYLTRPAFACMTCAAAFVIQSKKKPAIFDISAPGGSRAMSN